MAGQSPGIWRHRAPALLGLLLCALPALGSAEDRLVIDDPRELAELEQRGFSFAETAVQAPAPVADNETLYANPLYKTFADLLTADLRSIKADDPRVGTAISNAHRRFHGRWLRSPFARYELVGVVNRMDRKVFRPDSCGELRMIYRLAYRNGDAYSRLPMTVNVVHVFPEDEGCAQAARRWSAQKLDREMLAWTRPRAVEVNLQSVRWPSGKRPDMGGHAEYFLRVFKPRAGKPEFYLAKLENTPDVARLQGDAKLKSRLLAWIRAPENFTAIDEGWARVPPEFLVTKASSVSPHGVHRLANMPFSQVFDESDLADLPYARGRHVRSPYGLLRRLNDLSCTGCHQGRAIAGFHFVGVDREGGDAMNGVAVAASPHFSNDQPRRQRYLAALLAGETPAPARALSLRADEEGGHAGAHCGLGDASSEAWGCDAGLQCVQSLRDEAVTRTGICQAPAMQAGSACETSALTPDRNAMRDKLTGIQAQSCGLGGNCVGSELGFPGGMCVPGSCRSAGPGEVCGAVAFSKGFNDCLHEGKAFSSCLAENTREALLQRCDAQTACREDYICSRTAGGEGACIPPYFLLQLRVDGHPSPMPDSAQK